MDSLSGTGPFPKLSMMLSPAHLVAYPQVQCLLVNGHFINPNTCMENSVRTFLFCAYAMFIHEAPGDSSPLQHLNGSLPRF